ncbi:hypothetical protein BTO06_01610 [Tenacibaculum sp. SZ-18]|uniref:NAD(P)/FAD-dependent oxidoreductase n=1 Tax=Tenacibaculum sp. SZ-18 TaxID=754423 RepID=UPI000C2D3C2D|nr:FAD-dependent monooxygenase [Tenacibaculum sp. SZ-18]AUC13928.1 hypothetical protein BTO06_01610 [Tenacibaculum sp. SZ-18]
MGPETLHTDTLIVGNGVSGLILHYVLQRKGINSILLSKSKNQQNLPLAETLPPSTLELLEEIKLLRLFESKAKKTYGYQSKWVGTNIIDESFFLKSKFGYGLKIDKKKVSQSLKEQCNQIIEINEVNIDSRTKWSSNIFVKNNENKSLNIHTSLLIDATGRKRYILKQAKIKEISYDDTLAFLCYVPKTGPNLKYGFLTEVFSKNSWGTVSDLNETTRIISLYTSKENKQISLFKQYNQWKNLLHKTDVLKHCIPKQGNFKVYGRQANSSIPEKITHNNILSIGDAALAFDPIASHGVSNAIYTAKEAAYSIENYLANDHRSLVNYEQKLYSIFNEYISQKEKLYEMNFHKLTK